MENVSNVSSEEELLQLRNEGKVSEDEYIDLLAAMRKSSPGGDEKLALGEDSAGSRYFGGYEYRSEKMLFGLPLVHIVLGPTFNPVTGKIRVAKGIIAIGGIACGMLALGGITFGAISLGGLAVGLVALGGCALGVIFALGGLAIGFIALGGVAIGYYAIGGGAWGVHALGGNARDQQLLEFLCAGHSA